MERCTNHANVAFLQAAREILHSAETSYFLWELAVSTSTIHNLNDLNILMVSADDVIFHEDLLQLVWEKKAAK